MSEIEKSTIKLRSWIRFFFSKLWAPNLRNKYDENKKLDLWNWGISVDPVPSPPSPPQTLCHLPWKSKFGHKFNIKKKKKKAILWTDKEERGITCRKSKPRETAVIIDQHILWESSFCSSFRWISEIAMSEYSLDF